MQRKELSPGAGTVEAVDKLELPVQLVPRALNREPGSWVQVLALIVTRWEQVPLLPPALKTSIQKLLNALYVIIIIVMFSVL